MPDLRVCPKGHEWQPDPGESSPEGFCPYCSGLGSNLIPPPPSEPLEPTLPRVPGYEILGELGAGGMGIVYRARHRQLDRLVALKMIQLFPETMSGDLDQLRERFRTEAEAVARLQHPNIVHIFELGEYNRLPYLALEYVEGGNLARGLANGPLTPTVAAALVEQLAGGVAHAHARGVLHRDLKPENVLLQGNTQALTTTLTAPANPPTVPGQRELTRIDGFRPGSPADPLPGRRDDTPPTSRGADLLGFVPRITDFGLARRLDASSGRTQSGAVLGTPSYMAPEQAEGKKDVGPAADVYALGAILYECLTGRPPFRAASVLETLRQVVSDDPVPPSRLNSQVPRDLETICLKCLHKQPTRRYASAQELGGRLRLFLEGRPIPDRPVGPLERALKWARRRPAAAALVGVVVLAALTLLGVGLYFTNRLAREVDRALASEAIATQREADAQAARAHAEESEQTANSALERTRRALFTHQLWRAGSVWRSDPWECRALLDNIELCPPEWRNFTWGFYHRLTHREKASWRAHKGVTNAIAFSPTKPLLASAGDDGLVRLWSVPDGKLVATLDGHSKRVEALAFSPDGVHLVSGGMDGRVQVWDVASGKRAKTLLEHPKPVWAVAYSPDGKWVAVGSGVALARGEVTLFAEPAGKQARTFRGMSKVAFALAFSPDAQTLAAGSGDFINPHAPGDIKLWEVKTGADRGTLTQPVGPIWSLAWAPDGLTLAAASGNFISTRFAGAVTLWDVPRRKLRATLRTHLRWVRAVAITADGKAVASGSQDSTTKLWDLANGEERTTLRGHEDGVRSVTCDPSGRWLASAANDGVVKLWDVDFRPEKTVFRGHTDGVYTLAFTRDSARVLSGGWDGSVRLWDVRSGKGQILEATSRENVFALAVDSGDRYLAVGGGKGRCEVWELNPRRLVRTFDKLPGDVRQMTFLSGGDVLVVVEGASRQAKAETVREPTRLLRCTPSSGAVREVLRVPDPQRVRLFGHASLLVRRDELIEIREGDSEKVLASWDLPEKAVVVEVSPDGRLLATRQPGSPLIVRDTLSGKEIVRLRSGPEAFRYLAFHPDGRTLAGSTSEGDVELWDLATGYQQGAFPAHTEFIGALAFSPDGRFLATGSGDQTVKLFEGTVTSAR